MTDTQNRQRWAKDQKEQARAAFAETIAPVSKVRGWRMLELRQMEKSLEQFPHMADTLAMVRAEIAKLQA